MLRLIFVFSIIAFGIYWSMRGSFYALLFYMWNAYFRPEQWVWNGALISSLNLSYIIGLYLAVRTIFDGRKLLFNGRVGLVFLFAAQCVIGTITSEHFDLSFDFLTQFAKILLISYLIVVQVTDRRRFKMALLVMAFSIGFECAKQGWVNLYRNPGGEDDNPVPFLGDNNGVALGMMMLTPLFGGLAAGALQFRERFVYRFMAIGTLLRGVTTYSRGGFIGAAAVGVMSLLRSDHKVRALLGIALVAGTVWVTMPQKFWDRMQTITSDDREGVSEGRTHFWDVGVTMAKAKPLTGVGLDGFDDSYDQYDPGRPYGGDRAAHSTWFGVLGDLGYPGLILFVANWAMALWSCWRIAWANRARDPGAQELRGYANALATSLIAFAVCGTFLSVQYSEMFWHVVSMCTALHLIVLAERRVTVPMEAAAPAAPARPFAVAAR